MAKEIKHLLELYNQKRYLQVEGISADKMLRVDSEEVTKMTKKNHSYLICTCESSGKTAHNSLCRHKQFFIVFPILEFLYKRIDKLIDDYERYKKINMKINPELVISDLKDVKYLK